MQVVKFISWHEPTPTARVGVLLGGKVRPAGDEMTKLAELLHVPNPMDACRDRWERAGAGVALPLEAVQLVAPIDRQEVWGAGVTYERSKVAREEESESAATFYDRVYRADRPELFFKATPSRVVGPGMAIRVRQDSDWCVPEPELALVLSPSAGDRRLHRGQRRERPRHRGGQPALPAPGQDLRRLLRPWAGDHAGRCDAAARHRADLVWKSTATANRSSATRPHCRGWPADSPT